MKFVLQMAARETRASWRRLLFFFICIAVGVAAIVALRSVIQDVRVAFASEAKSLIAADVLISTNREWTERGRETIARRVRESGATRQTETVELGTMVRPVGDRPVARMVELRAVQEPFPLYGTLKLEQGIVYSHDLLKGRGVLVGPELLTALDVRVGDRLLIGEAEFTIRGVIVSEPGRRVGGFSMGPRALIDFGELDATRLLVFGSRARRVVLVRMPEDNVQELVRRLREDFRDQYVSARSFRATDDEVGRDFNRAEDYLSLVGLVIVILGGIAVSSVTRVFVLQKIRSIAVLKCVGANSRHIILVYLLQVLALGMAGSLLGVAIAGGVMSAIPLVIGQTQPLLRDVQYTVTWSAAVQGVVIGILVSVLFSIVPLLRVRHIKPSLLLRDESAAASSRDWVRIFAVAATGALLVALTVWQAGSLEVGLIVCVGFCAVGAALLLAGRGLVAAVAPLARSRSFPLRHAVLHLSRPGNQTRVVLLAVGLGAFFVVGVRSLQANLLEQFSVQLSEDAPDMFLIDVQRDQVEGLGSFLKDPSSKVGSYRLLPVLRARVTGVSGRDTNLESYEDVRARGGLSREYTITYRDQLEPNERIVDGQFWNGPAAEAEVSVERGLQERFRINVGDTVRFDILGQIIAAKVTSIREVEWRDSRSGGFMFVFRPGALDDLPQGYIAPLKGPAGVEDRARFQRQLVDRFPNVSVIDFRDILLTLQDVMSKVTLAITVVGGLVLFSGGLILVGAVAMTKFQRVYQAAVFRTLGASTRAIAKMLVLEYGVLGLLAGLLGSVGAIGLTWAISRYALDIPWRIFAGEHVGAVLLAAALVAAVGVLSSADVLRNKPLATLRSE